MFKILKQSSFLFRRVCVCPCKILNVLLSIIDRDTADTQIFLFVLKPYEFLTAMTVKNTVFCNVTSFIVLESCQPFEKNTISTYMLKDGARGGCMFLCTVGKFLPVQAQYHHRRQKS